MVLCDTNILIEVYRGNFEIPSILEEIGQQNLAISDVTAAELMYGARNKKELALIKNDIDSLNRIPISSIISDLSLKLIEKYSLSHKLFLPDALIAATAIEKDILLYTLNLKDFQYIDGLKLFKKRG